MIVYIVCDIQKRLVMNFYAVHAAILSFIFLVLEFLKKAAENLVTVSPASGAQNAEVASII